MNQTIRLGRIAGVRVGLHWSALGLVILIAVLLAVVRLPSALPGYPGGAYALGGVCVSLLLMGSLLGHEMAHAVVARRNGVRVDGITLWLLGGLAQLRGEARTAASEFRIAAVGPAASVLLGVVFGAAAWGTARLNADVLIVSVLFYLALLNIALAVFNLVPAAPLDGGRVLKAVLWALRGDRFQAAVWSARAGLGLGLILIVGGFVQLFARGGAGLWWVLLGLFIAGVASAEQKQAKLTRALADVRVGAVMSSPVEVTDGRVGVEQFLRAHGMGPRHEIYPLLNEDGQPDGLVLFDKLRSLSPQRQGERSLRQVSSPLDDAVLADRDESLASVLPRMLGARPPHAMVVANRVLVGIVRPADLGPILAERGLRALPGTARRHGTGSTRPPPSDWWYPGQR